MNFTGELVYISNNTSSNIPVRVILRPVSPLMVPGTSSGGYKKWPDGSKKINVNNESPFGHRKTCDFKVKGDDVMFVI